MVYIIHFYLNHLNYAAFYLRQHLNYVRKRIHKHFCLRHPPKGQTEAVLMKTNRDVSLTTTTIISSCPYQRLPL